MAHLHREKCQSKKSEAWVKSFCLAPGGGTLKVYQIKQSSWYLRSDSGNPFLWVAEAALPPSMGQELVFRQQLCEAPNFPGTQPKVNPQGTNSSPYSVLKPLILPNSSAFRTVSPTSELQHHLHLFLTLCSLVSRIPFTKQSKKSCSLNFSFSQLYTSCTLSFFPRLIEAWPAKPLLTWKYLYIFIDIL